MRSIDGRARGSLRSVCAAMGLAAALCLLGVGASAQGVVTLESPAPPDAHGTVDPAATPTPPADPQEALLAYVQCMRDHGVDMPDPQFTDDGGVVMRIEGRSDDDAAPMLIGGPGDPAFDEAQEVCGPLVEGTVRDLDPEQVAEMQARALAFARCMRANGVDMPDPRFDGDSRVAVRIGGSERIEPDVMQQAMEACNDLMGPPPGGAEASPDADADATAPGDVGQASGGLVP